MHGITEFKKSMHPAIWAAGFTAGMAAIGYLEIYAGIGRLGAILLMIPMMALLIPMVKSVQQRAAAKGCASPALVRYNRRFMVWTFGYMAALTLAITIQQKMELSVPMLWLAGLFPGLPVLGMIWTMIRYMREEEDEYLRLRAANAALIGTALLLAVATPWGFLEMFDVVPHIPSWAAFPLWATGLGIGQILQDRKP
jgi:hypothetical protein